MKYIFIAGLEHSGSTLTNYLLSQPPKSIGLGEVWQFFNHKHTLNYIQKWGHCDDVNLYS